MVNGELIGFVSVPESHGKVTTTDPAAYLAWVEAQHPSEVEEVYTVPVTDELLDFLHDNGGDGFVVTTRQVRDSFTQKVVRHGKDYGGYKTPGGEIDFDIPGVKIERGGGALAAKVDLLDDLDAVMEVLTRARAAGVFDVAELLALPSSDVLQPGQLEPGQVALIAELLEVLKHDGCGGWTWNRRTNQVRCACGATMVPPAPPKPPAELADGAAA
jgi:hypothetical protein